MCRSTRASRERECCGTCKRTGPLRFRGALEKRTDTSGMRRRTWTALGHVLMTYRANDNVEMGRVRDLPTITETETERRRQAQKNLSTLQAMQETV